MKKRLLSLLIFIGYIALLIKVMVFKDIPTIKVGQLMLNFGGTESGHGANLVPFTTIVPYLFGHNGLIIAGINIVGNIVLLVPLGFLLPFVYPHTTWKKSLALAVASGLCIELLQTILHVGIFDIDDVILNVLGFMIGYWAFIIFAKWLREKKYLSILIAALLLIAAAAGAFNYVYPWGQPVHPRAEMGNVTTGEGTVPQNGDLCGGTGGIGQITSIGSSTFTMARRDGSALVVTLASNATIKTSAGTATLSDLKIGDRATLVGDANPNGSFTASAVFICS